MSVHSIDLNKKRFILPSLEKIKCRGLYPARDERKNGYALFNGASYIDTEDARDYSGSGDFSVCAWIRKSQSAASYAICQSHSLVGYASDWIIAGGGILFWMRSRTMGSDNMLNDYKWHHLTFAWNRGRETYKGYVDGAFLGESDVVSGYGGVGSVKIATRGDAVSSFWLGSIAHVKMFLRELTATEIKNIFEMATITHGLSSHYPLFENVRDYGEHGKDGVNHGAVFVRGW